jgi:hypothetical protein
VRALLTLDELAAALKVKREFLHKEWRRLHREHGFPMPMPGLERRWDPRAIELWQDNDLRRQGLLPALAADAAAQVELRLEPESAPSDDEILAARADAIAHQAAA